jgi:hypothetical protein
MLKKKKEEHLKRITHPARLARFKTVDPHEVDNHTIAPLPITHPHLLTLDTTSLSATEAATRILHHAATMLEEQK